MLNCLKVTNKYESKQNIFKRNNFGEGISKRLSVYDTFFKSSKPLQFL